MKHTQALLAGLSASASATHLFASDYSGDVNTLSLTTTSNGSYNLKKLFTSEGCAPNPSWLTIDPDRGLLFCMNEGLDTKNGSLSSFTINRNGSLNYVTNYTTPASPVSGIIYGEPDGNRALAVAHYDGAAVTAWALSGHGNLTKLQEIDFNLTQHGPDKDRQDQPYGHQAIVDPTGQYVLVPDLGADLVRVYSWNHTTLMLKPLAPLVAPKGFGPRHAAFYNPMGVDGMTFMYLVGELSGDVASYDVSYLNNNGGLTFRGLDDQPATGPVKLTRRNAPAEIHVSPDNRFLIVSNRNDSSATVTRNGKQIPSDSITTFSLGQDGSFTYFQSAPAGGDYPRQYSINAAGNLLAIGLQNNHTVAIRQRNVTSGRIGKEVARVKLDGEVTCVVGTRSIS